MNNKGGRLVYAARRVESAELEKWHHDWHCAVRGDPDSCVTRSRTIISFIPIAGDS